eukprot:TCONS_00028871-protein
MLRDRIVIPKKLQFLELEIMTRIHAGHNSIERCEQKRRSRQSVIWPGTVRDVESIVKQCRTCARLLSSKPKSPLSLHQGIPDRAWQQVDSDIFYFGRENYLIVAD